MISCYCSCSAEGVSKAKEVVKPFDWTFTTNYMGTASSRGGAPDWEVGETKLYYYVATALIRGFFPYRLLKQLIELTTRSSRLRKGSTFMMRSYSMRMSSLITEQQCSAQK